MHFFSEKGVASSPDAQREPSEPPEPSEPLGGGVGKGHRPGEPRLNGDPLSGGDRRRPLHDFTQQPSPTSPQSEETLGDVCMLQKM